MDVSQNQDGMGMRNITLVILGFAMVLCPLAL
jgi:hypothetical protein